MIEVVEGVSPPASIFVVAVEIDVCVKDGVVKGSAIVGC